MQMVQTIIQFFIENESIFKYVMSVLVGGGIIWKLIPWGWSTYKKVYSFDMAMNEINKQNKILAKRLGIYVNRPTLDSALDRIKAERCRVCAISGPAGSGKTRFALNIIKRNKLLSKYYYVYINKSNAGYFDSDEFKQLNVIKGNRNYVFIFDYVYENVNRINSLLKLTEQTQRHKFILVEREYNGLILPRDFDISMAEHKMDLSALCQVFLNVLPAKLRKRKRTHEEAKKLIDLIYNKLEQTYIRPVFADLAAKIYLDNQPNYVYKLLEGVSDYSDLIELYWNYKFNSKRIEDKCLDYKIVIDETFMANIDILMRSLLLITAVTKRDIIVDFRDSHIRFTLDGVMDGVKDITEFIYVYYEKKFWESIERLSIEGVREIFGVILKDSIIINKSGRDKNFKITSQLDIVSEWLMSDSLAGESEYWIGHLRLFLRKNYNPDLCRFMARGALDFPELIQHFEVSLSDKVDSNEYLAYIYYSLQKIYEINSEKQVDDNLKALKKFIREIIDSSPEAYKIIQKHLWIILKEIYGKNFYKKDLTKKIIQIMGDDKYE